MCLFALETLSPQEDQKVRDLVDAYGPNNWSKISQELPGRVGKQCRERCVCATYVAPFFFYRDGQGTQPPTDLSQGEEGWWELDHNHRKRRDFVPLCDIACLFHIGGYVTIRTAHKPSTQSIYAFRPLCARDPFPYSLQMAQPPRSTHQEVCVDTRGGDHHHRGTGAAGQQVVTDCGPAAWKVRSAFVCPPRKALCTSAKVLRKQPHCLR